MTKIRLAVGEETKHLDKCLEYLSSSSVYEIFPDSFMTEFTKYKNFTDFCQAIGCDITSQEDLDKLQDTGAFNTAIRSCSDFESWKDMIQTAYQKLIDRK